MAWINLWQFFSNALLGSTAEFAAKRLAMSIFHVTSVSTMKILYYRPSTSLVQSEPWHDKVETVLSHCSSRGPRKSSIKPGLLLPVASVRCFSAPFSDAVRQTRLARHEVL
eukprot:s3647_g6.t1